MSVTDAHPVLACAGIPIAALSPEDAVSKILWLAKEPLRTGIDVHLCNAYTLALADRDPELHRLLSRAKMNLPDGTPVVWANRALHRGQDVPRQRVRGPSLFQDVFERGQESGVRHYLLGSTPDVLDALVLRLTDQYPKAEIVGTDSPPFRELTEAEISEQLARIESRDPDIVWVGLGTPKQDFECARLAATMRHVVIGVGAAFDFAAGTKPEAAEWVQRSGLEWVHRFAHEPRRLWRRYLFGNTRFLRAATRRRGVHPDEGER
jgi:N-acetylglucosaminyldiphosphoundecaprenol N-acetyl-beta-D-mannosaminyltransferase